MRSYICTKLKAPVVLLVLLIITAQVMAQTNTGIFFQAVARDNYSNPAMNRKIYVQSSIIQTTATGTKLLIEEYESTTDGSGVFSISIGNGKKVGVTTSGIMTIDWSKGPFYLNLKIAITPVASSNGWDYTKEWTDMGTTNFGAVPYALYSANAAGLDGKLNIADTAAMLSKRFALDTVSLSNRINVSNTNLNSETTRAIAAENLKLSIADTAFMLNGRKASDTSSLSNRINASSTALSSEITRATASENLKLNIADTASLSNRINASSTALSAEITRATVSENLKLNIVDTASLSNRINASTTALSSEITRATASENLKLNIVDTASLSNRINTKENQLNKSTNTSLGTSDVYYPTQNAVKTYVDAATPGATTLVKGMVLLAGDLSGTAELPVIAAGAITTSKIADANVTSSKIADANVTTSKIADANVTTSKIADGAITESKLSSFSGSKVTGDIGGNAANVTGTVAVASGGTGATNVADARANLGLVIGTNVQSLLPAATTSVDGYLSRTDFTTFNNKMGTSLKGAIDGVASLGSDGKIPSSQLPAITLSSATVVATEALMLALSVTVGSIAIRTDVAKNYVLGALPPTEEANWKELAATPSVTSVNTFTGPNILLTTTNISEGTNLYYTDARARAAISASSPLSYSAGLFSMPAATTSADGYLSAANFTIFNNKQTAVTFGTGLTNTSSTITVNTSQNIAKLSNLTSNGIVTTTGSAGTLAVVSTLPVASGGTGALTLTGIVKGNGTGAFTAAIAGTDYLAPNGNAATVTTNANLTGNVTSVGNATTIATGVVTNANLANVATATFKGRTTAATGVPEDLTVAQAKTLLNLSGTNTGDQTLPTLSSLGGVASNLAITGATNTKITYDTKGLVTSGSAATTADIAASTNKNYVTDAQQTVIGNTSGTNTGDNSANSLYSGLVTNATHTGDATGSTALTVVKINGTLMSGLATGILKNTTSTGVPSIAIPADFPNLNQNTTGTAANVTGIVGLSNGGTGSSTRNFVDLTSNENIAGEKKFKDNISVNWGTDGTTAIRVGAPSSGTQNTMLGAGTFVWSTPGNNNTALGNFTLASGTGGNENTAVGTNALRQPSGTANGNRNTAVGFDALGSGLGASDNVAIGVSTLRNITTSGFNIAVGNSALTVTTTGALNTAVGYSALSSNTTGFDNTAIGYFALSSTTTSGDNTALGYKAGITNTTGSNNTFIGNGAIGSTITISNEITLGNATVSKLRAQVTSITALSDRRDKTDIITISEGLDFLKQLKPVSFTWNTRDKAKVGIKSAGFIAQDLLALQKKSTIGDHLDLVSQDNPDKLEARYGNLLPVIVKAIQEESAQKDTEIAALKALLKSLAARLQSLETIVNKQ